MTRDRARLILLNAALGPLDYRVPLGMTVAPGSVVVAPLGPRQLVGVVWEPERAPAESVGDNRLRPLLHAYDVPPIPAALRRLIEWTSDYYLAPMGAVLRMALPSAGALEGARSITEYRTTGYVPDRMTPQREQALERIGERMGLIRELAIIGLANGRLQLRYPLVGRRVRIATRAPIAAVQLDPRRVLAIDLRSGRVVGEHVLDFDVADLAVDPDGSRLALRGTTTRLDIVDARAARAAELESAAPPRNELEAPPPSLEPSPARSSGCRERARRSRNPPSTGAGTRPRHRDR